MWLDITPLAMRHCIIRRVPSRPERARKRPSRQHVAASVLRRLGSGVLAAMARRTDVAQMLNVSIEDAWLAQWPSGYDFANPGNH